MPELNWNPDEETLNIVRRIKPIIQHIDITQFRGKNYHRESWIKVIDNCNFIENLHIDSVSSPTNIITCFQEDYLLEGLSMVVLWGTMFRQKRRIYAENLESLKENLLQAKQLIQDNLNIESSWNILVQNLGWTNVTTSKVLHFLSRALDITNPPVPIDNAIIKNKVWRQLREYINGNNLNTVPKWFDTGNTFAAYNRYMTAIIVWAEIYGLSTIKFEAALFNYCRINGPIEFGEIN